MSSSSSVNEWDNDYAGVARIASQHRTQGLRHADPRQLFQRISRLDESLSTLPIPPAQILRRRRLLQHLRGERIDNDMNMSSAGSTNANKNNSESGNGYIPPSEVGGSGQQQSQMSVAMQQQDAMIDELAVGVGRLRDQTQVIGDESRMHVTLLNDMEQNLEVAYDGLESETRNAARLKEDQSVWRLQLIVAGLFVLFVLLVFLGLSP
mmetsp:Transcript_60045/g.68980  ORF Transcript_60045/g.68980 Transcript_60045/m.68980 type:complete len:208 (+) Transcript_60045:216-839(+)